MSNIIERIVFILYSCHGFFIMSQTVMIVDDDQLNRELLETVLKRAGYSVNPRLLPDSDGPV